MRLTIRQPVFSQAALAGVACLLLWAAYTALQCLCLAGRLSEPLASGMRVLPGLLGVAVLGLMGIPRSYGYLRTGRLSRKGLILYLGMLLFYIATVLPTGRYTGLNWMDVLVYAPLNGVSQELFFRAFLLPVLVWVVGGRFWLGLIAHALLFGLWHVGAIFAGASLLEALPVILVPFVFGIGWGWQVSRDRTILWSVVHHSLLLVMMSLFSWN